MKLTSEVAEAVATIKSGRVAALPTGTSYALAVDALQGHALQRLRNVKRRPAEKSFTVCLAQELWEMHLSLSSAERRLLTRAEEEAAPLTLLVQPRASLAHIAHDGRLGIRAVDHPLLRAVVAMTAVPLTATSANVTGEEPCVSAQCVLQTFPGLLDPHDPAIARAGATTYDLSLGCVLDAGELTPALPSTIAYLNEQTEPVVVRSGALSADDIAAWL